MIPEPTSVTSTQLLDELRHAENRTAWSSLDERYRPIITGFAIQLGLSAEDASDVAQQTLVDFFTSHTQGRYDRSRGRLRAYVLTIARNRAMDVFRKASVHNVARGDSVFTDLPDVSTCEELWEKAQRRAIAEAAWEEMRRTSKMDEQNLKAFELVEIKGLPAAGAAAACDMTVENVYKAVSRATMQYHAIVQRLVACLEQDS